MALNKFLKFGYGNGSELKFYYTEGSELLHIYAPLERLFTLTPKNVESLLKFLQETPEFDKQKCQTCCERLAEQQHTCPYKADVNNDSETLCNCCDDCRKECLMDI